MTSEGNVGSEQERRSPYEILSNFFTDTNSFRNVITDDFRISMHKLIPSEGGTPFPPVILVDYLERVEWKSSFATGQFWIQENGEHEIPDEVGSVVGFELSEDLKEKARKSTSWVIKQIGREWSSEQIMNYERAEIRRVLQRRNARR